MASVGSGKSLMISDILLTMEKSGKRALCLVNNAELVRNNCATFQEYGGHGSIWCAQLKSKDCSAPVVFGTPQSILNGITKNKAIAHVKFNLIVVDEAHNINYINHRSCFMRILRHYKQEYQPMRILGGTGTNFRFKGSEIVGDNCFFKSQVGNITTSQLIDEGYLIKPTFRVDPELVIDFSQVKVKANGQFDSKQLAQVVSENARLTELICKQVIHIVESQARFGCFLFATTRNHANEIMSHLPSEESALILGDTPQVEREIILNKARQGSIKYLVNISIISVGVDIPAYDTIAYLRPTESLVLLVQTMGRALRLSPKTAKREALVLDFAGNISRHSDWDDPVLLDAVKETEPEDIKLDIQCPKCQEWNPLTARRCRGVTNKVRCDYFFEFKECKNCQTENDIASRICRNCNCELIDPNAKLSMTGIKPDFIELKVLQAKYGISGGNTNIKFHCAYICIDKTANKHLVYEHFYTSTDKAKRFFYATFVKKHFETPSDWYINLGNRKKMEEMLKQIKTPNTLLVTKDESGYKIKVRLFEDTLQSPPLQHLDQQRIQLHTHEQSF